MYLYGNFRRVRYVYISLKVRFKKKNYSVLFGANNGVRLRFFFFFFLFDKRCGSGYNQPTGVIYIDQGTVLFGKYMVLCKTLIHKN